MKGSTREQRRYTEEGKRVMPDHSERVLVWVNRQTVGENREV